MAKRAEHRTFSVCVVGLSGTEKEKGTTGIGKSCLCNRFMRPLADHYCTNHISVLSQSDFSGRVVNNDHFLYWGEVMKTSDEGVDLIFNVIEQTEFIDDSSFQPFKIAKMEPYCKRCASTKQQSAEKLMYICKDQLGLEHEFEQKMLPDGRITIDGFLCLFDVSVVHQRSIERQLEQTAQILTNLLKTKKPVVLVTTKNDIQHEPYIREAEKLATRKEYKGNLPIVETSAHANVNIELAFLTLAHLIDRTKARIKLVPYEEAARQRREVLEVATEAYQNLIRSHVTDYKTHWMNVYMKLQHDPDYIHYVDLFSTGKARELFLKHTRRLKSEFLQQKEEYYIGRLNDILKEILPDLSTIADRSWPNLLRWFPRQDWFSTYIVELANGVSWRDEEFLDSSEERIPFDLLDSDDAEKCYRNHLNTLRALHKRSELKKQFKRLLEDNHNVCPGKNLAEVAIFFLGRECFSVLSEAEKHEIYEQHQRELREQAKQEFLELLGENADLFTKYDQGQVTAEDLREINERLQNEPRYRALDKLKEDRKVILLNHLGFIQCPHRTRCPFKENCMELLIEKILDSKAHRPQSWNRSSQFLLSTEDDNRLNLLLLGSEGLADQFAKEIRLQCVDDEYTLEQQIYSLDYRIIDGDVSLPHNSFKTAEFLPHGCFCVFNSERTLEFIRDSVEKTLIADLQREDRLPFQGLPIVIVLAHDHFISDKELMYLREDGQQLADKLQCPFIDIPSSMMVDTSCKFHEDQIGLAIHALVQSIKHRSSFVTPWQTAESIEPDIRILMCFMCGDSFTLELPLAPLLNHQCCYVTSDKFPTITLETYLDESKRKVEVTLNSYHGATLVRGELYHGFILVYSAKRKASLSALRAFALSVCGVPLMLLAVTESNSASAFFSSEYTQNLITEGNALADSLGAGFTTTCQNFHHQTVSYTPFFKNCWDKKGVTEATFSFAGDESGLHLEQPEVLLDRIALRPPAALPKGFDSTGGPNNSTSNSTEDSDPIYDQPHIGPCHSDSEGDRASSTSPPPGLGVSHYGMEDYIYSEVPDTEHLIKPSQVKSKRHMYAERYRKSFPSASSSFASSSYREDSTDTDSSVRSPKLAVRDRLHGQPHYQFRKSNSMKLALKEDEEGIFDGSTPKGKGKRTSQHTSTPKSKSSNRPRPLNLKKYAEVTSVLNRNIAQGSKSPQPNLLVAPLATPEGIEIGDYAQVRRGHGLPLLPTLEEPEVGLYAQVMDAISTTEDDYAKVADALPTGKLHRIRSTFRKPQHQESKDGSDSDSDCSSPGEGQKEDIYTRVHRRPTPHKKKHKVPRHQDRSNLLHPNSEEHRILVQQDQLEKGVRSNSPSEESEGTGDEILTSRRQKRRSLKSKKKSEAAQPLISSPPWSEVESEQPYSSSNRYPGEDNHYNREDDEDSREELENSRDWRRKLRFKQDSGKLRRKEEKEKEKRAREDEKRRMKEEEKKQKMQRKLMKKSISKSQGTPPQSSVSWCLDDLAQSEDNMIPLFLEKCVNFIEQEGLNAEGIYRVPGNRAHVDSLMEKFKEDRSVDIASLGIPVNAIATALKQFFGELPDPIVPNCLCDELIEASVLSQKSARLLAIRGVLQKLPQSHFEVLKYTITHLRRVSDNSSENNMDSKNLAICLWPTLLRPDIKSLESMSLVSKPLEEMVQMLIEQCGFFFYGENEV